LIIKEWGREVPSSENRATSSKDGPPLEAFTNRLDQQSVKMHILAERRRGSRRGRRREGELEKRTGGEGEGATKAWEKAHCTLLYHSGEGSPGGGEDV